MKLFIYKTLFVFGCIFLLFQLTIGVKIKEFKYELNQIKSKENIIYWINARNALKIYNLFPSFVRTEVKFENKEIYIVDSTKKNNYKDKLRDELKNAVEKENYLSPEDAKLINNFINKIKSELSKNNQ